MIYSVLIVAFLSIIIILLPSLKDLLLNPKLLIIPLKIYKYFNRVGEHKEITWKPSSNRLFNQYQQSSSMPNVILIVADDLGYNDLSKGFYGVSTPNIDSIYQNGISFKQAYAGHATCAPSRAALFTGKGFYPIIRYLI